jgi:capsular exopolysaccharide synthesis family protein
LLLIENSKSKALTLADLYNVQGGSGREAFNSEVQILRSRPIAEMVIRKLDLVNNSAFNPPPKAGWFSGEPDPVAAETETAVFEHLLLKFSDSLMIEPLPNSQIVKISFDSTDAELSAKIANAVADAYIENDLEARSMMTQRAKVWLTQRMADLRKNLEESEKALQQYREKENIIDNKGVVLGGSAKQLEELSTNLVAGKQRLSDAQGIYNQVKDYQSGQIDALISLPAIQKNPGVQRTKENVAEAARKLSELQGRYTAAHPKVIAADAELRAARDALKREVQSAVNGITREYELARANVAANTRELDQVKAEIQGITRKEFKLSVLMRDVESSKQLYDMFVSRAKETDVASNFESTAGRIVDPAVVPPYPIKPKKTKFVGIALMLGLLGGIALVFLKDYMDNTMHNAADVERRLGMEVLGMMQKLELEDDDPHYVSSAYLVDPNTPFAESVRTLRTAVLLSAIDEPHRVVMVTSTLPGEGKTTVATNLAFALGQMKKVLLIDGDIRRPGLSNAMGGLEGALGLVDYLAEEAPLKDCIHTTDSEHVFVVPAGKRFNSPLEFLSSQRFGETIDKLKQLFDVVIIDCPPLRPVSDSLVISTYANAVLYVVKADSTPYQLANSVIKRLHNINAHVLGVVLSQVDIKKSDHYGHYAYEYAYGRESKPQEKTFLGIRI